MPLENRVSITIPEEVKAAVLSDINDIKTKLAPFLIALTEDERQALPKAKEKTISFIDKGLNYVQANPKFAPAYIDAAELSKDVIAANTLLEFLRPLEQIVSGLDDTAMEAASEAYIVCLAYYNTVTRAAELGIPDIYDDLKVRFPQGSKKSSKTQSSTPTA
jgi:hypothetical protein